MAMLARRHGEVGDLAADTLEGSSSAGDRRGERPRRHRDLGLRLDLPICEHERGMAQLIGREDLDARDPSRIVLKAHLSRAISIQRPTGSTDGPADGTTIS
jgi:hypothetical protein